MTCILARRAAERKVSCCAHSTFHEHQNKEVCRQFEQSRTHTHTLSLSGFDALGSVKSSKSPRSLKKRTFAPELDIPIPLRPSHPKPPSSKAQRRPKKANDEPAFKSLLLFIPAFIPIAALPEYDSQLAHSLFLTRLNLTRPPSSPSSDTQLLPNPPPSLERKLELAKRKQSTFQSSR